MKKTEFSKKHLRHPSLQNCTPHLDRQSLAGWPPGAYGSPRDLPNATARRIDATQTTRCDSARDRWMGNATPKKTMCGRKMLQEWVFSKRKRPLHAAIEEAPETASELDK